MRNAEDTESFRENLSSNIEQRIFKIIKVPFILTKSFGLHLILIYHFNCFEVTRLDT